MDDIRASRPAAKEPVVLPDGTQAEQLVAARREAALGWLLGRINYELTACPPYRAGRLKLARMRELLARLDQPERGLDLVHIAGTKGKGSTAALTASILTAAGYRTGIFSSPHLDRVEERLAVDGQPCSAADLVALVARVRPVVEAMDGTARGAGQRGLEVRHGGDGQADQRGPTYFEITTALAILYFAEQQVDAAVLEVGLGGRLDSTNVFQPQVSIITSISLDHTQQLGNSLAAIAREKAGIIKPGVTVVSGVTDPAPRGVIRRTARQRGCRLLEVGTDFTFDYRAPPHIDRGPSWGTVDFRCCAAGLEHQYSGLRLRLLGHHQAANSAVALAAIAELNRHGWAISESAVRGGLATGYLPARVEVVGRCPTVIVDVAHNVASVEALVRVLHDGGVRRPWYLVFAVSQDKDIRGMLRILGPEFDQIILTCYRENPRAASVEALQAIAQEVTATPCRAVADPAAAWQHVRAVAASGDSIVVTGSFYLAAEMRRLISAAPLGPAPRPAPLPAAGP